MVHRARETPIQTGQERPYETHVFVCTSGTDCPLDGQPGELRDALKKRVKQAGLKDRVRINHSGCLNQCGHGPNLVVYPEGVWYSHVSLSDVDAIMDHITGRTGPVERLRYRLGPGGCKAERGADGKSTCDGSACQS